MHDLIVVWIHPEGFLFQFGPIKISLCHWELFLVSASPRLSLLSLTLSVPWLSSASLLLVLYSWYSVLLLFLFFPPLPFSLTFSSLLLGSVYLPASLCISQYLLNLCSLYHSFSFSVSLSAFLSPPAETVDSTEETRSQMCTLLFFVTNCSIQCKTLELTRRARRSKNSQEKLHFPEEFEQIWVRRGLIFVKWALWS